MTNKITLYDDTNPSEDGTKDLGASGKSYNSIFVNKAGNLTDNGFVKTSGGDGTLSVDTNTYLTTISGQAHDLLDGLSDDDHTQYLRIDGTRAMTGNFDLGSQNIVNCTQIGVSGDTDLLQLATNSLTINGDVTVTGDITVNGDDIKTDSVTMSLRGSSETYLYSYFPNFGFQAASSNVNYIRGYDNLRILAGNLGALDNAYVTLEAKGTSGVLLNWLSGTGGVKFYNGSGNVVINTDSSGNMQLDGNLKVDGGYIGLTADTDLLQLSSNQLVINGVLQSSPNTDSTTILGRTRIDSRTSDNAFFSHYDMSSGSQYALRQTSSGFVSINSPSTTNIAIGHNGGTYHAFYGATGDVEFDYGNDTLYIDVSAHRIGIGTDSPSAKLDVNGNARINGTLTIENSDIAKVGGTVYSNGTAITVGATTDETDMMTYTIPANTLVADGDYLELEMSGYASADEEEEVDIKIYFGSEVIRAFNYEDDESGLWHFSATVIRRGESSQYMATEYYSGLGLYPLYAPDDASEDLTSAIIIKVTGTKTDSGDTARQDMMTIKYYPTQ